jgi:hypothetical protein
MTSGEGCANGPGNEKARQQIYPGSNERTQRGRGPGSLIEEEVAEVHGMFPDRRRPAEGAAQWGDFKSGAPRHTSVAAPRFGRSLADALTAAGEPLLFAARLWAFVCRALFVAFWLELDNPFWAGRARGDRMSAAAQGFAA